MVYTTEVSGRASRLDYSAFRQKALVRRDLFEKVRKNHRHNHYCIPVPGICLYTPSVYHSVFSGTNAGSIDDTAVPPPFFYLL